MDDENSFHNKTSVPSILGTTQGPPVALPRDAAIQELSSKYLLDVLKAYGKEGEALIQRFRVQWVEYTSNPIGRPTSFDDYMRRRLTNFGKGYVSLRSRFHHYPQSSKMVTQKLGIIGLFGDFWTSLLVFF
jgi:hypothetical protein